MAELILGGLSSRRPHATEMPQLLRRLRVKVVVKVTLPPARQSPTPSRVLHLPTLSSLPLPTCVPVISLFEILLIFGVIGTTAHVATF